MKHKTILILLMGLAGCNNPVFNQPETLVVDNPILRQ